MPDLARAPNLARHVGAANGLLHAAARRVRQQALPHAHDLHRQLAAGHDHHRLRSSRAHVRMRPQTLTVDRGRRQMKRTLPAMQKRPAGSCMLHEDIRDGWHDWGG